MLSTSQLASPRARLLLARNALNSSPSTAAQQSRQFCGFDLGRRRHRVYAFKYLVSLNRRLAWENPKSGSLKAAASSTGSPSSTGKYTDLKDVKSWSDDLSGARPGRSIEDVERDAINHLFHKDDNVWTPLQNIRNYLHSSLHSDKVTAESVLRATTDDSLNFIDPITNRRVSPAEHGKYSATKFDDPNAPRKLTPEEESKQYTDLGDYKPSKWNEPDGLPQLTPEERSKIYGDLPEYSKMKIDNPNAPRKLTPEEESKNYDDLDKYKSVTWNEPDGLPQLTPEEKSKLYEDLDRYGPVQWNEPNGLQERSQEEKSKDYQDLHKYGPATFDEPDGLRRLTPEEKSKNYTDLHAYGGPFTCRESVLKDYEALQNDPTPKAEPIPAKVQVRDTATAQYDDLDQYGPVRWHEPDGLRPLTAEELSKDYEDLHMYSQFPNAGPKTARVHPEEASKAYQDLPQYSAFPNAGPKVERVHPEEASKNYKDLPGYAVDGFVEPAKTRHIHPEELTKNYADLGTYEPQSFESPDKPYPMHPEQASKAYKDLHGYNASSPDVEIEEASDVVAASLREYDAKEKLQADMAASGAIHHGSSMEEVERALESLTADDIRSQVLSRVAMAAKEEEEAPEMEMSSMDESFPSELSKSESEPIEGITRKLAELRAEKDPYSNDPKGLETSYSEECGDVTPEILAKHYESIPPTATLTVRYPGQPVQYKILAYDASTQSVSVAETTSDDADASAPPKLTDVLLQLSHAAKFLPYFKPLQEQGYDIVSGGGDVLIFRKTRPAVANASDLPCDAPSNPARVNPVDMMGQSVAGNFASPTGFVNYDSLEDSHVKPAPPLGTSQQTRRDEAERMRPASPEKKRRSFGKKVVMGTVWVGGAAYAVGALAEHFSAAGK
ncbi:hypothetical protein BBK36DRAFT_1122956 [Trichoderma citrinoviride]|uniref:Serine-threonine rich protein n=1 Tax=Trichoderma citrinoviride TaxID=58853 RepID=A0A2T4B6F7_9HYPO|nr:hypothetical protein BBK36DRAFT_1122956 [Trichoderma citrinoviride]PTB64890.1 hypothetical protein BBK36DRAFT_1122956 [Trichoderma citrinoviride]